MEPKPKKRRKVLPFVSADNEIEYYGTHNKYKLTPTALYVKEKPPSDSKEEAIVSEPTYRFIGKYIKVLNVIQANETNDVSLDLEFSYRDKRRKIEISREQLQPNELQKLNKKGADIFYNNVKEIIQFLRIQEESAPFASVHQHVGWMESGERLFYKHDQILGENAPISTYNGKFNLKPKGTLEGWKTIIREQVLGNENLELALVMGFSAVIVGMLSTIRDTDTLILHLSGGSTKGKTTATQLAVSAFGRPSKTANGLIKSWNATGNAVMVHFRNNHGLPVVLDETSMTTIKDLTTLIYTFAESREKERMDKEGDLREQGKWATSLISSAEHSLFTKTNANEGLRVRAFEFKNREWTSSAENADQLKSQLLDHYGHAGIEFIHYLQKLGVEEVERRCLKWKRTCEKTLETSDFITRVSEKFGILLASAELVNESLGLGLDLDKMLDVLYEVEHEIGMERSQSDKAYQFLIEKIVANYECFLSSDREYKGYGECWGVIHYRSNFIEVNFLQNRFHQLMQEIGVSDSSVVLAKWKEEGLTLHETNKHTIRRKVVPKHLEKEVSIPEKTDKKGQSVVYAIKFDNEILGEFGVQKVGIFNVLEKKKRPMLQKEPTKADLKREEKARQQVEAMKALYGDDYHNIDKDIDEKLPFTNGVTDHAKQVMDDDPEGLFEEFTVVNGEDVE